MTPKIAENPEELTAILKSWQALETATVAHTTEVIAKTKNPLIQLVMEIIRQDSEMHYRVQQVLLDSLENQAFTPHARRIGRDLGHGGKARRDGEADHRDWPRRP